MKPILIISIIALQSYVFGQHTPFMNRDAKIEQKKVLNTRKSNFFLKRKNELRSGFRWDGSLGYSVLHFNFSNSINYRLYNGFEFGIGFGLHSNRLTLPINYDNDTISISSVPVFVSGKYILLNCWNDIVKPYVKTRVGYTLPRSSQNKRKQSGLMYENGIGIELKMGRNSYTFIECSRYFNEAKGSMSDNDRNLDVEYDLNFNKTLFRIGFSIGFN